ncbi:uncharacterized protein PHACADRAFT_183379 [Phanerochaete carnosa HHB-10118-sp]|uniref:Uncharacterized protein n=1 Tax=Phanerochaete carnosa (strain HHB-10118-sp) TaxID=650164 RepID=K5V2P6_PHACS|nr:uncharacterized protein PHACADRAFT_183379 [Phanerochaete carnosa HHB-10118-sp]EKM56791.1 hypothetical protein PHACADRAFT_183379 [Phanerochaete carnosa HHB-10118-sp]
MLLVELLKVWCKDKAIEHYGHGHLSLLGAGLVMTDEMINRIVDFAEKFKTSDNLEQELHDWRDVTWYATQILHLLASYHSSLPLPALSALPPLPPPNDHTEVTVNVTPAQSKTQALPRCSACRVTGYYTHLENPVNVAVRVCGLTASVASVSNNPSCEATMNTSMNSNPLREAATDTFMNSNSLGKAAADPSMNNNPTHKAAGNASMNSNFMHEAALESLTVQHLVAASAIPAVDSVCLATYAITAARPSVPTPLNCSSSGILPELQADLHDALASRIPHAFLTLSSFTNSLITLSGRALTETCLGSYAAYMPSPFITAESFAVIAPLPTSLPLAQLFTAQH